MYKFVIITSPPSGLKSRDEEKTKEKGKVAKTSILFRTGIKQEFMKNVIF